MNQKYTFFAHDTHNNSVVLESEEMSGHTDQLTEKIKSVASILIPAYTQTEVHFAKTKPESVPTDFMLKSLAPFLAKQPQDTDWGIFEENVKILLSHFFAATDWKKYSGAQDKHIFVTVKDAKSDQILGIIQFLNTPEFTKNTIKAALYGVLPEAENRGLEKLLMSSIFAIYPETDRIFLHTRATNQAAIDRYIDWGFKLFSNNIAGWPDFEYRANETDTLQQTAATFITQK